MAKLDTLRMESILVSSGRNRESGEPLNVPPIPASNFVLGGKREYSRDDGTASWDAFEEIMGELEGGRAVSFSSGMAAISAVFGQLGAGAKIAIPKDCYQAVVGLAEAGSAKFGWQVERIPVSDTQTWIRAAKSADLLWLESPSNPLLEIADLEAICAAPRDEGAILAVDNTFATPLNQLPLTLGADVVVHSATKFIGGHSDLLAGVAITNQEAVHEALRTARLLSGACPGALETFLAIRGVRTLALRLRKSEASAETLASKLEQHPAVALVRYPGLQSHPGHSLARTQLGGFGTMISFDVNGGAAVADSVCARLQLIQHATSLGAVESTIERRAAIPGQEHLPAGLLRLSVGIEDVDDLWSDLSQALAT